MNEVEYSELEAELNKHIIIKFDQVQKALDDIKALIITKQLMKNKYARKHEISVAGKRTTTPGSQEAKTKDNSFQK